MRGVGVLVIFSLTALLACSQTSPGLATPSGTVGQPSPIPASLAATPASPLRSEVPTPPASVGPEQTLPTNNGGITERLARNLLSLATILRDTGFKLDFNDSSLGPSNPNECDWLSSAAGNKDGIMLFLGPHDFAQAHWIDQVLADGGVEVSGYGDRAVVAANDGGADWTVMGVEIGGGGFVLHALPAISAEQIERLAHDVLASLSPST